MRLLLLSFVLSLWAGVGAAQDRVFVQIEAHPNLAEATSRARAYGSIVDRINGFALGGGWYALALGPYDLARAQGTLQRLRGEGLIPRDSYVTEGETYRDRFWPVGAEADPPDSAAEAEPAPEPARQAPPAEETPAEARRSEAALTRAQKMELQRAMQWFGHYTAAIDGSFGRGTRSAMASWQDANGVEPSGVLTSRQRQSLLAAYAAGQATLGLAPLVSAEAGVALTAPLGLVAFDRIEAPFVHYAPAGDSGVRLSLISQEGDRAALAGLYEILQTLDIVPPEGERSRSGDSFRITGVSPDRTAQVYARLFGDHIAGYILEWPERQDALAARALPEMERTLRSTGPALPADAGFDASAQRFDMVAGLEVRRPLRSLSGFYADGGGHVLTAARPTEGCGRITLDGRYEAEIVVARGGVALLSPDRPLAPAEFAALAPAEGRLRSAVSVSGFPYGGALTAASLSFGTLEDVRGLDGDADLLRLSLPARSGDVGGPVLDPSGRVAGLLLPAPGTDATALPGDVRYAVKSTVLAEILAEVGEVRVAPDAAAPLAPEDLAARAAALTVLVECWE